MGLERDVVVERCFVAATSRSRSSAAASTGRGCTAFGTRLAWCAALTARSTGPAAQHLHLVGVDLGRVTIATFLVLPFARAQPAFDVHLRTLAQVFGRDFGQPIVHDDVVPLGLLALLARLFVLPAFGRGD